MTDDEFATDVIQTHVATHGKYPTDSLLDAMFKFCGVMFLAEGYADPPEKPESNNPIVQGRYLDQLEAWNRKRANIHVTLPLLKEAVLLLLNVIQSALPNDLFFDDWNEREFPGTTPLGDRLLAPNEFTKQICAYINAEQLMKHNLLHLTRGKIFEKKMEGKQGLELLADGPVGWFLEYPVPLAPADYDTRYKHSLVCARTGHGKTQLLGNLILWDLQQDNPPATVVLDSTGSFVQTISKLKLFDPTVDGSLADRLIYIDPTDTFPPAMSLLSMAQQGAQAETQVNALIAYALSDASIPLTGLQETMMSFVIRLVMSMNGNLQTMHDVLNENPSKGEYANSRYKAQIETLDETAQGYFRNEFFGKHTAATKRQIATKLYGILTNPTLLNVYGARVNKIDWYEALNKRAIILCNTAEGELDEKHIDFSRYLIAQVMLAVFKRQKDNPQYRVPTFLWVDEAAGIVDSTYERLLIRARQLKCGTCACFQSFGQLEPQKLQDMMGSQTSIKYMGGLDPTEARRLAARMGKTDPNQILETQPFQYVVYYEGHMSHGATMQLPRGVLQNQPPMDDAAYALLMQRNRERFGVKPEPAPPTGKELATAYVAAAKTVQETVPQPPPPKSTVTPAPSEPSPQRKRPKAGTSW